MTVFVSCFLSEIISTVLLNPGYVFGLHMKSATSTDSYIFISVSRDIVKFPRRPEDIIL